MDIKIVFEKELYSLKQRYPNKSSYVEEELENAINIFRSLRQDFKIEEFNDYEKNWIKRCTIELLSVDPSERNVQSYSENGYSYTRFEGVISKDLRSEIFPIARGRG